MAVDESDRAIARSVLALGRDLGLVTVAEGVESREGWDLLTALGCDMAQGFVVCPPLTSPQFGDWLDRRQPEEFAYLHDAALHDDAPAADDDVDRIIELRDDGASVVTGGDDAAGGTGTGDGNGAHDGDRVTDGDIEAQRAADGNGHGPGNGDHPGNGRVRGTTANGKGTPGEAGNGAGARGDGSGEHAGDDEAEAAVTDEPG
jgi:hypothetical protein